MPPLNRTWHEQHPMPAHPTADQRIAWHQQHAAACACRPVPAGVQRLMADRTPPPEKPRQ